MSKEQFFMMRAEQMATMYDQSFTKKDAVSSGVKMITDVIESGNVDKLQLMANLCRLKEVINAADSELRKHLPFEKNKVFGVEFTPVNGGETLNYSDDEIWSDLKKQLSNREELLKTAFKTDYELYDSEGILVPKVSSTPRKSSITIKF